MVAIMEHSAKTYWLPDVEASDVAEEVTSITGLIVAAGTSANFVFVSSSPRKRVRGVSVDETEQKFRRLVKQWREETEHLSSITKASMHPAYQRIIGMGYQAIPLLLRELQTDPDHWFWALNAITEQDPAQSEETFDGAVRAWLKWGRDNDHL